MFEATDILLVEDSVDELELALLAFKAGNITRRVKNVRDGLEALDFLFGLGSYVQRDVRNIPGLILLDLNLPKVHGLEVLRRLRLNQLTKNIPIVILTNSAEWDDVKRAYEWGADSYIQKPLNFTRFVRVLQDITTHWLDSQTRPILPQQRHIIGLYLDVAVFTNKGVSISRGNVGGN